MKYRKMCFNAKNKISELNRSGLFLAAAKTAVPPGKIIRFRCRLTLKTVLSMQTPEAVYITDII